MEINRCIVVFAVKFLALTRPLRPLRGPNQKPVQKHFQKHKKHRKHQTQKPRTQKSSDTNKRASQAQISQDQQGSSCEADDDQSLPTPLAEAAGHMLSKLGSSAIFSLVPYLHRREAQGPMTVGTACSGCDVILLVLDVLEEQFQEHFDVRLKFKHLFAVEIDLRKQEFLRSQWPETELMFEDVADLNWDSALDVISGRNKIIPHVDLFAAGFSCTARNRLNVHSKQNKDGLQRDAADATAMTWRGVRTYIQKGRPKLVLLENVTELDQSDTDVSDASYILDFLRSEGYTAATVRLQARDHGSFPSRLRLYFLAVQGLGRSPGTFLDVVRSMRIEEKAPLSRYLLPVFAGATPQPEADDILEAKKRRVENCKFRDQHCELFRKHGLQWPVVKSKLPAKFAKELHMLTERSADVAFFCEFVWPWEDGNDKREPQFLDVHMSLPFLVNTENRTSPWKTVLGCLAGSTRIWMRLASLEDVLEHRLITGTEAMQFIGWDVSFFKTMPMPGNRSEQDLLMSMAGNAYSGFALAPALMALLTVASVPQTHG